jgi:mannose-6-phosphate isomerase
MKQEKKESRLGTNETFVDPNHKPEVAVVLSDMFQGFVGFRPIDEIRQFVRDIPELGEAIGETNAEHFAKRS